jgi:pimeloyl-ACP methyl ester carboxylesterase
LIIFGRECLHERWDSVCHLNVFSRVSVRAPTSSSTAIVLVHGLGVSSRYMTPLACELAKQFSVLVPDLPGFGRSEKPRHVLNIVELAEYLRNWLACVHLGPTLFIGNSMGCQILVELAHLDHSVVQGVAFLGPTMDEFASTRLAHVGRLLLDQLAEPPSLVPLQAYEYLHNGPFRTIETFSHAVEHKMLQRASDLKVPCLILRGEKDPIVSQAWVEALGHAIPSAEVGVISKAAHALNYSSAPRIVPTIIDFWRRRGLNI